MDKKGFSRNFRYPSAELREQVRAAVKERGFRSEQAFLIAACEHEIRQGANTEATEQFEAPVAATLTNLAKQVLGLQTLAHAQVALTDVFLSEVRHHVRGRTSGRCATRGTSSRQVALRKAGACCRGRDLDQEQRHSQGNGGR